MTNWNLEFQKIRFADRKLKIDRLFFELLFTKLCIFKNPLFNTKLHCLDFEKTINLIFPCFIFEFISKASLGQNKSPTGSFGDFSE